MKWHSLMYASLCDWNIYIYLKLNSMYQISSIFIGSPDSGYQLIYLHYQTWPKSTSWNKERWVKILLRQRRSLKKRLPAESTNRYSVTGPKYKWNSPLHCSECFRWQRLVLSSWSKSFPSKQGKFSVLLMFSFKWNSRVLT